MSKEIKLIYQDCVACNGRESWAEQQYKLARHYGFAIKRTPHTATGAAGLIRQARQHGVMALAFFTDGTKFSTDLMDFVKKETNKPKPAAQPTESRTHQRIRAVRARSKKVADNETTTEA